MFVPVFFSVEVVTAASSVLKSVLATPSGYNFAAAYKKEVECSTLIQYLQPFKAPKRKVQYSTLNQNIRSYSRH